LTDDFFAKKGSLAIVVKEETVLSRLFSNRLVIHWDIKEL
jgi:hypothetical protein